MYRFSIHALLETVCDFGQVCLSNFIWEFLVWKIWIIIHVRFTFISCLIACLEKYLMTEGCERGKLGDQGVHSIRATVFNRRKETLPMKATTLIIRKLYIGYRCFIRYPPNSSTACSNFWWTNYLFRISGILALGK